MDVTLSAEEVEELFVYVQAGIGDSPNVTAFSVYPKPASEYIGKHGNIIVRRKQTGAHRLFDGNNFLYNKTVISIIEPSIYITI